jgi:hypothetical protein
MISFCGGEPTLEMELLEYGCKKCEENGIKKSIITNLWWHNNQEIIDRVTNLNLDALQISVDSEHLKNVSVENILNFSKAYRGGQIIIKTLDNEKQEIKKYFKDFLIIGKQLTSEKDKGCNHNLKYCHLQGLIIDPEGYIRQFCTLSTFHNCIRRHNIKDINLKEFLENEFPELITYRIVGKDTLKYFFIGDLNNLIDKELDAIPFKELSENDIKLDLMNYFKEGVVSSWGPKT